MVGSRNRKVRILHTQIAGIRLDRRSHRVGSVATELPAIGNLTHTVVIAKHLRQIPNIGSVDDLSVIKGQSSIVVLQAERIIALSIAGPVIGVPVACPQHLAEGVVDQEIDWTGLLLPSRLQRVVVGVTAVSMQVHVRVVVERAEVVDAVLDARYAISSSHVSRRSVQARVIFASQAGVITEWIPIAGGVEGVRRITPDWPTIVGNSRAGWRIRCDVDAIRWIDPEKAAGANVVLIVEVTVRAVDEDVLRFVGNVRNLKH